MDTEKLKTLIQAMEAKRNREKLRLSGSELRAFLSECAWYIEGVRDAIRVAEGMTPAQVRLPPDVNSISSGG